MQSRGAMDAVEASTYIDMEVGGCVVDIIRYTFGDSEVIPVPQRDSGGNRLQLSCGSGGDTGVQGKNHRYRTGIERGGGVPEDIRKLMKNFRTVCADVWVG